MYIKFRLLMNLFRFKKRAIKRLKRKKFKHKPISLNIRFRNTKIGLRKVLKRWKTFFKKFKRYKNITNYYKLFYKLYKTKKYNKNKLLSLSKLLPKKRKSKFIIPFRLLPKKRQLEIKAQRIKKRFSNKIKKKTIYTLRKSLVNLKLRRIIRFKLNRIVRFKLKRINNLKKKIKIKSKIKTKIKSKIKTKIKSKIKTKIKSNTKTKIKSNTKTKIKPNTKNLIQKIKPFKKPFKKPVQKVLTKTVKQTIQKAFKKDKFLFWIKKKIFFFKIRTRTKRKKFKRRKKYFFKRKLKRFYWKKLKLLARRRKKRLKKFFKKRRITTIVLKSQFFRKKNILKKRFKKRFIKRKTRKLKKYRKLKNFKKNKFFTVTKVKTFFYFFKKYNNPIIPLLNIKFIKGLRLFLFYNSFIKFTRRNFINKKHIRWASNPPIIRLNFFYKFHIFMKSYRCQVLLYEKLKKVTLTYFQAFFHSFKNFYPLEYIWHKEYNFNYFLIRLKLALNVKLAYWIVWHNWIYSLTPIYYTSTLKFNQFYFFIVNWFTLLMVRWNFNKCMRLLKFFKKLKRVQWKIIKNIVKNDYIQILLHRTYNYSRIFEVDYKQLSWIMLFNKWLIWKSFIFTFLNIWNSRLFGWKLLS